MAWMSASTRWASACFAETVGEAVAEVPAASSVATLNSSATAVLRLQGWIR